MEFVTKWREYRCRVAVELCKGDLDALEGGVQGSVINGCQGGEWEVWYDGVGSSHGGNNKNTVISSELGCFQAVVYEPLGRPVKDIIQIYL